jgi:hypothetical protein
MLPHDGDNVPTWPAYRVSWHLHTPTSMLRTAILPRRNHRCCMDLRPTARACLPSWRRVVSVARRQFRLRRRMSSTSPGRYPSGALTVADATTKTRKACYGVDGLAPCGIVSPCPEAANSYGPGHCCRRIGDLGVCLGPSPGLLRWQPSRLAQPAVGGQFWPMTRYARRFTRAACRIISPVS